MAKSKSETSEGPRLIGYGLMATGIIFFISFILLAELFGATTRWDPLPFFFFILLFALGLMLVTNQIRVWPAHQKLRYCPKCHRALSRNERLRIWYCSSCKIDYENQLRNKYGYQTPRQCPVCQMPLAIDEKRKVRFCHTCQKRYEQQMESMG